MNLSAKVEPVLSTNSRWDSVKWFFVALLICGIFVANIFLPEQTSALRLLWNLVAGLIVLGVASFTQKGKRAWNFAKEARVELRKVVWPTRQETIQSTVMIMVVVIITALFLWGVDSILLWAIGFVTGQRG
ncbi:MAG TPA: preprotein translocase subunit SecE [Gammaproteobacteria bacterium]|nr:preprotein translocase subunit SecE [Gammaproteobacteria bacterium]